MNHFSYLDPYGRRPVSSFTNAPFEELLDKIPIETAIANCRKELLQDLQGGILWHHSKDFCRYYLIEIKDGENNVKKALDWISKIANHLTRAIDQSRERNVNLPSGVCSLYLSWEGYKRLGIARVAPDLKENKSFSEGIPEQSDFFQVPETPDPVLAEDPFFKKTSMALLIASDDPTHKTFITDVLEKLLEEVTPGDNAWCTVRLQTGIFKKRRFNDDRRHSVEWFGFRDGISQPHYFPDVYNIDNYSESSLFPLRTILTKDPGGEHWYSAGSFMTFLKMEQDVRQFKQNALNIADKMKKFDPKFDPATAEAYMIGRFSDGTSLTLENAPKNYEVKNPRNEFTYDMVIKHSGDHTTDREGIRCPFASHVRKANPRIGKAVPMARRGTLYDERQGPAPTFQESDLEWQPWSDNLQDVPKGDIGLLFVSFQSSIDRQFEYVLQNWMNSIEVNHQVTGVDLVVGAGKNRQNSKWYLPKFWANPDPDEKEKFSHNEIESCVRFKGGGYFYAPSISLLENIRRHSTIGRAPKKPLPIPPLYRG